MLYYGLERLIAKELKSDLGDIQKICRKLCYKEGIIDLELKRKDSHHDGDMWKYIGK